MLSERSAHEACALRAQVDAHPRHGARALALALAASLTAALGGCGAPPAVMSPGGSEVTFQLWGDPAEPPTIVQARRLTQDQANSFDLLHFTDISVRRPLGTGVVVMTAPSGTYSRNAKRGLTLDLDRPVLFSGALEGDPILGMGDHAVISHARGGDPMLTLYGGEPADDAEHQAVVLFQGMVTRSHRFDFTMSGTGEARSLIIAEPAPNVVDDSEMPDLAVVMAGLPHPLVLPAVLPGAPR